MGQRGRRVKKDPIDVTKIDPSRYKLFNDNIHIAYDVAKKFYPRPLLFEDAIQIAQEGLWKACLNFDESKGFAFSTLAYRTVSNTLIKFATKESMQEHDCFISLDAELYDNSDVDSSETRQNKLISDEQEDTAKKIFENYDLKELEDILDEILENKSDEEKKLFSYLKQGRSFFEIKEDLGVTRIKISKFREKLVIELYEYGYFSKEDLEEKGINIDE